MDAIECATEIVKKLNAHGYIAYFAGGWVRDHLLQHPSSDIDIATDAPPPVILDLFPNTILVGLSFGVVIVIMHGLQFEVATFRRDVNYSNGRKPEQIELSTPQEDAKRRDFTINGMFYDPLEKTIYDFVGGAADLKKGIIRTIGDPNARFIEDRLRMIRAIRFACRFGFAIDPFTQAAIVENASTLFPAVAMERIWQEFNKMSCTPNFDHALIEMHRLKLLPEIFPSLEHVHLHTIKQQVSCFSRFPEKCPAILLLLALFLDRPLEAVVEICQVLKLSNQEISLAKLFFECKRLVSLVLPISDLAWVYFYANPSAQLVLAAEAATHPPEEQAAILEKHQLRQAALKPHIDRVIQRAPLVTASLLMKHGFIQGKLMGDVLKEAERIAVDYNLHSPEAVLQKLKII